MNITESSTIPKSYTDGLIIIGVLAILLGFITGLYRSMRGDNHTVEHEPLQIIIEDSSDSDIVVTTEMSPLHELSEGSDCIEFPISTPPPKSP